MSVIPTLPLDDLLRAVTVSDLQGLIELEKTVLARRIHDELGGYLIASAMDVTNLRHRFAAQDDDALEKFDRLARMLNQAIDMMRGVTEELHPTLLDNVGLFAALRWQMKHLCHRTQIACEHDLPQLEPTLGAAAGITLYRLGQEALVVAENQPDVTRIDLKMSVDADSLHLELRSDGTSTRPSAGRGSIALGFLRNRIEALGGDLRMSCVEGAGMCLSTQVSLQRAASAAYR